MVTLHYCVHAAAFRLERVRHLGSAMCRAVIFEAAGHPVTAISCLVVKLAGQCLAHIVQQPESRAGYGGADQSPF